jgi:hypothetical protein
MAEIIYNALAVKRGKDSLPLYVFWDKQCLNYGQNWEEGFVNGLMNATAIVLLVSNQVHSFSTASDCYSFKIGFGNDNKQSARRTR